MFARGLKGLTVKAVCGIILLSISVGVLTGCELPFKTKASEAEPTLIPVMIHFTGDSEPLFGYVKELDVVQDATVYLGGSSTCRFYNAAGEWIGVFNYARTEYVKTTLPETSR